ncbi:MAG: ABC transporter permease subunit [Ornithinibacter sp.]
MADPSTHPSASTPPGRSVIHDLGYRPYTGPRLGEGAIALALVVTGLRNVFGLGRSARSKVLPFILLGLNLLPAAVLVGVMVLVGLDRLPLGYAQYASTTQVLLGIFVAAQAPVLFSRDLRHGTIALYLARPLRASTYALARWVSLLVATLVFIWLPVLLLYVGALLGELDAGDQTRNAALALLLGLLLGLAVAGIGALISSWSTRRGFAVVATIAVLLIANGVVTAVQAIAIDEDRTRVAEVAGLFSPYSLYRGAADALADGRSPTPPTGTGMETAYVAVLVLLAAACLAGLVWRYRRLAGR